jgi:PIN domain nuclease of toxin-antitoxin system
VILLDTQAAAWLVTRPQRLSRPAADAIRKHAARNELAVASVTLMELGLMLASGEIRPTGTPQEWLRGFSARSGAAIRELDVDIAAVAAFLPPTFPGDPFDRLIAATAIVERAPLVTSDSRIQDSGVVRTIW